MTPEQFSALQKWHIAKPGRSIDIKMDYSRGALRESRLSICLCAAEEGIAIEWITPDDIANIDEVMRQRGIARLTQGIDDDKRLLEKLSGRS